MTHRFVITGAMGAGKTALLRELTAGGFAAAPEPAREVIAEHRAATGEAIYDKDVELFLRLMLERAVADFEGAAGTTFFDRGIVDLIGYAELFKLDPADVERAAAENRYNDTVFVLPSWPEIYTTDEDRRMSLEHAARFGGRVREIYAGFGYTLVDVPKADPASRAMFITDVLEGTGKR